MILSGRKCDIYEFGFSIDSENTDKSGKPRKIMIMCCGEDGNENDSLKGSLIPYLSESSEADGLVLVFFYVSDWNSDFSPWKEKAVFGDEDFAGNGGETLDFLTETLIPFLRGKYGFDVSFRISGYSLAGLFSLWAFLESDMFIGCAACSPSVWFEGWKEYLDRKALEKGDLNIPGKVIYLSLGDREANTKNIRMQKVLENIRYTADVTGGFLELNPGGHFKDVPERLLKGILYLNGIN